MSPSLAFLKRCSAETGYQVSALEKVVRLGEVAADIARHPLLGEALALKGGTALNLCFGFPGRLSVDLDYNYIAHVEREKMLADRPRIETAVIELARRQGYSVQQSADAFAGRKLHLRYRSALGPEEPVEVDLNYLFRLPLAGTETSSLWQPGGLGPARVRVVSLTEIIAGKLLALLDRCAPRDAWDVAHLSVSSIQLLQSRGFRTQLIALSAILDRPLSDYGRDRLEHLLTDQELAEQLLPMLSAPISCSAAELVDRAWAKVAPFLALEVREEEYISALQRGELRLDLLFPDDEAGAEHLSLHPALQWKLVNVRAHRSQARRRPDIVRPGTVSNED